MTVAADAFLANAARWLPALPLLGMHLRKVRPYVADLARCEQLAHLNGLYLGDNDLTNNDLATRRHHGLLILRPCLWRRGRQQWQHQAGVPPQAGADEEQPRSTGAASARVSTVPACRKNAGNCRKLPGICGFRRLPRVKRGKCEIWKP